MEIFGTAHGWGRDQKDLPSLKSVIHILQLSDLAQSYLTKTRSKIYMNHVTQLLCSADISIFSQKSANFAISRNSNIYFLLVHNS